MHAESQPLEREISCLPSGARWGCGSSASQVLEVGAGDGRLTHFLRVALARQLLGGDGSIGAVAAATTAQIRVVATDSNERQLQTFYPVEVCTAEAALQKYQPVQFCSP